MQERIKVVVTGVAGKMGKAILAGIVNEPDIDVVGATDVKLQGTDVGLIIGSEPLNVFINDDLEKVIQDKKPDVIVDFTNSQVVMKNIRNAVKNKVSLVIGTTGFTPYDIDEINLLSEKYETPIFMAPNFALGAVLMMRFAQEASRHFPFVEIIEKHHDQKLDAPSGTAIKTMELIAEERKAFYQGAANEFEKIPGSRGGDFQGMRVHSIRLPGFVAHQEVIFGGEGQTLTIRHDSNSRESFAPGVLLAIRKVKQLEGVVNGLEKLLW